MISPKDPWIARGEENQQIADRALLRAITPAEASSIQMYREAVNAESPRRGGLSQAPPRYSISTKTLRMVEPPYGDLVRSVSRFHRVFAIRDSRPAMKDSIA